MSVIIFYFSGTGNSYEIARVLSKKLTKATVASIQYAEDFKLDQYQTIGVVFPVYYLHAPEVVVEKIKGLRLNQPHQVFMIGTYAGTLGFALEDVKDAVDTRAGHVQTFSLKMPGNYLLEYGAFPNWLQNRMLKKAAVKTAKIADIISAKTLFQTKKPNLMVQHFKKTADEKVATFEVLGSQFSVDENCKNCGICAKICPMSNIVMENEAPKWHRVCQQCMACVQWCPQNAINHPKYKRSRKRYVNPTVTIQELISSNHPHRLLTNTHRE